jgi:DNA invertase Pin-like site-specific DNA recombinase
MAMTRPRNRRVAIYTRVSTDGQTCANQERKLRAVAERKDCEIVKVYIDRRIGGAKGRDKRPQFDALCKDAVRREFDCIMAWSVDRLGRSLQDLIAFLNEIHAAGVDLYLHVQGLDTSTPAGKATFQMLGVFAEFERALIREPVVAGLNRAKAQGKTLGRPRVDEAMEAAIRKSLRKGVGIRKTATALGVGTGTVQRIKAESYARLNSPEAKLQKGKRCGTRLRHRGTVIRVRNKGPGVAGDALRSAG